jgi:hypothetical protein
LHLMRIVVYWLLHDEAHRCKMDSYIAMYVKL